MDSSTALKSREAYQPGSPIDGDRPWYTRKKKNQRTASRDAKECEHSVLPKEEVDCLTDDRHPWSQSLLDGMERKSNRVENRSNEGGLAAPLLLALLDNLLLWCVVALINKLLDLFLYYLRQRISVQTTLKTNGWHSRVGESQDQSERAHTFRWY